MSLTKQKNPFKVEEEVPLHVAPSGGSMFCLIDSFIIGAVMIFRIA